MSAGTSAAPAGPALGIDAKSVDRGPALGIDAKSVDRGPALASSAEAGRSIRYRLKRLVERLLFVKDAPKQERVCTCHRRRKGEKVQVLRDTKTGRAHFTGLESCSNVWLCPVCSLAITEHRRRELQAAIDAHVKRGGEVYLVTQTMPHVRADTLGELLELLRAASKRFCQSKQYRQVSEDIGRIGNIRSLEVTWGSWHGWHPHFHVLVFAKRGQIERLRELRTAWVNALLKVKAAGNDQVNDLLAHAFDVQNGDYAAEYVAKYGHEPSLESIDATGERWGLAREMTNGQAKVARRLTGRTPFTLLLDYERGNVQAGQLFREFAASMKGQRQLYWSNGLRDALGLGDELDDEQVTERTLEELQPRSEKVGELDGEAWKLVIAHNARYHLLWAAEKYGADGVRLLLTELRMRPPTHSAACTESRRWG